VNMLNKEFLGRVKAVHVLRIHGFVNILENIFNRALGTPIDNRVFYLKGRRLPLPTRAEAAAYAGSKLLSNKPWHPVLAVPLVASALEYFQYTHADDPMYFTHNPAEPSGRAVYSTHTKASLTDVIDCYLSDIPLEEATAAEEVLIDMYNHCIRDIFEDNPNSVFVLNTDSSDYLLEQYCDIGTYRLKEAIDVRNGIQEYCRPGS